MPTTTHPNLALVFPEAGHVLLEEKPVTFDSTGASVLVESEYSLISPGTELAMYTGTHVGIPDPGNKFAKYPFRPGYVVVGRVAAVGAEAAGFAVGERVFGIAPHTQCHPLNTTNPRLPVLPLDPEQDPREALFARLAAISLTALLRSHPSVDRPVVILGMGLIGNLAAQLYTLAGCRVIGVDVVPERLAIAKLCGLHDVMLSTDTPQLAESIRERFGREPEIVVEATGVPELINTALTLVAQQGEVVLLGSPRGQPQIDFYAQIHRKGVSLTGAHEELQGHGGNPGRAETTRHMLSLLQRDALKVSPLITREVPPSQSRDAYETLLNQKDKALGVILRW